MMTSCARLPRRIVTFAWARLRASMRIVAPRTPRAISRVIAATMRAQKVRAP